MCCRFAWSICRPGRSLWKITRTLSEGFRSGMGWRNRCVGWILMKCWPSSTANLVRHESIAPCRTQPAKRPWLVVLQSVHTLTEFTSLVLDVKRYTVEKYTQVQLKNTQSEYKLKFYIHILFMNDGKFGKSSYNHCIKPSC